MQDPSGAPPLRPMASGCSRILGDRRLRPHHPNQPLKCPRCDSVNTKFCYYNNYNLSQPRHFCKSCRRYWTKGGVLRNVPVGGGCRKAKRSKTRSSQEKRQKRDSGNASPRSSSESSSLTATEPFSASVHPIPANSPLAGPPPPPTPPAVSVVDQIFTFPPESRLFSNPNPFPGVLEPSVLSGGLSSDAIFPDSNTFTSLLSGNIASSLHGSGFSYTPAEFPFKFHHQRMADMASDGNEMTVGFTDMLPSVNDMAAVHGSSGNHVLTPLDWQTNTDPPPSLFDLPNSADPSYWGQNQWEDHDHHSLYLP